MKKNILLGVSGSIAAYKALELIRLMKKGEFDVTVSPTKAALSFVTPLSLEVLSKNKLLIDSLNESQISHIEASTEADCLVIAPATANILAKMAFGLADEAILQAYLSFKGPVLCAPAMEENMWHHEATKANVKILKDRGVKFVQPEAGELASGRFGLGRMASVGDIYQNILFLTCKKDFLGKSVLVTAGPTREPLDPVRFLSNRSSGAMGVALANEAYLRGANVTVVHGLLTTQKKLYHQQMKTINIETAAQMHDAVLSLALKVDILIMTAAIADFRPIEVNKDKLSKTQMGDVIKLEKNPDILSEIGQLKPRPFMIGFAAQTHDFIRYGINKCREKNCDLVCVNDVSQGKAFGDIDHEITLVNKNETVAQLGPLSKQKLSAQILDVINKIYTPKKDL